MKTVSYTCVFHIENDSISYFFPDLPSGILCFDGRKDDVIEDAESALYEILTDDTYPQNEFDNVIRHSLVECKKMAESLFGSSYNENEFFISEISLETE